jgi:hypothetical protein
MYKKLIITSIALLFCAIVFAQEKKDRWIWPDEHKKDALYLHVDLGPKIGGGLAMSTNPSFYDFELKTGFAYQIGAALSVHVTHHPSFGLLGIGRVGMEIEAIYSCLGLNSSIDMMNISCLEIPVLIQFYVTPDFQVEVGATPTKFLNVSPKYIQAGNVVANVGSIQGGDVKLSLGACYKTLFGLAIGLRYNLGMSELAENFHSKVSTAMLSVNYMFPLIK